MLVKWVWCGVVDRAAFDGGQRGWGGLRGLPGFLGQGGGYSRSRPAVAHIFSCWADPHSYETFMAQAHDRFAATQAGTYRSIEVRLFDRLMDTPPGTFLVFGSGPGQRTTLTASPVTWSTSSPPGPSTPDSSCRCGPDGEELSIYYDKHQCLEEVRPWTGGVSLP
ncbi:MAG TPA: YdbC family protein [Micromonosporaceae bacterium]|nr:YdbC family protein [Micromonosporaceae bacterium]